MTDELEFLIVPGTVRDGRNSIHAANYLKEKLEEKHRVKMFDIKEKDIPLLKHTRYSEERHPEDVEEFGQMVESCNCIVLVSPEYNHSIPGALKNLLDYLYPEYDGKAFSFVTVSGGNFGGVRCLDDLRDLAATLGGHPGPDMPISKAGEVFDDESNLLQGDYEERFEKFIKKTVSHAEKMQN